MKASLVLMLACHVKSSLREPATKVFYRVQSFSLAFRLIFMQRMRTGIVETCAMSIQDNFMPVCIYITEYKPLYSCAVNKKKVLCSYPRKQKKVRSHNMCVPYADGLVFEMRATSHPGTCWIYSFLSILSVNKQTCAELSARVTKKLHHT